MASRFLQQFYAKYWEVDCSFHKASSCYDCSQGKDADLCHGDCEWSDGSCSKIVLFTAAAAVQSTSCSRNQRTGICDGGGCFPSTAEVILQLGVKKMMKDVKIGDKILSRSGTFEPIIGFLDKRLEKPTTFITLHTNMSSEITLTQSHVIFIQAGNGGEQMSKYARDILLGDVLLNVETETKAEVVEISESISNGYFAPLTESGTLVVDGYLASCYASYPHWIAHTAMYPARSWPAFFLGDVQEGPGAFVTLIKSLGNLGNFRNAAFPPMFIMDGAKIEF
jgi:hypothetical protein